MKNENDYISGSAECLYAVPANILAIFLLHGCITITQSGRSRLSLVYNHLNEVKKDKNKKVPREKGAGIEESKWQNQ